MLNRRFLLLAGVFSLALIDAAHAVVGEFNRLPSRVVELCGLNPSSYRLIMDNRFPPDKDVSVERWLEICQDLAAIGIEVPADILTKAPGLLLIKTRARPSEIIDGLKTIGFKDPLRLIKIHPGILGMNIDKNIRPKIENLRSAGFKDPLTLIERQPSILAYNFAENIEVKLRVIAQMGIQNPTNFFRANPSLLGWSPAELRKHIEGKVDSLLRLEFSDPLAMIEYAPAIVAIDFEQSIPAKLNVLRQLGVKNPVKIFERHPSLMNYTKEALLLRAVQLRAIGFETPEKLITASPSILLLDIEANVATKVLDLRRIGFADPIRLVEGNPNILGMSVDANIVPKLEALRALRFIDAKTMVENYPPLLNLNLDKNLVPTLHELNVNWGISLDAIEAQPRVLAASLARTMELREALDRFGWDVRTLPPSTKFQAIRNLKAEDILANMSSLGASRITEGNWRAVLRRSRTCTSALSFRSRLDL